MNLLPSKHLECEKSLRLQPADYPSGTVQRVLHSKSECTGAIPTVASSRSEGLANQGRPCTKEVVGGLFIIEADTQEEALRIASMHPAATIGEEGGWAVELIPMDFYLAL